MGNTNHRYGGTLKKAFQTVNLDDSDLSMFASEQNSRLEQHMVQLHKRNSIEKDPLNQAEMDKLMKDSGQAYL